MATIQDAAKALVATAGSEEDAAAAALELAAFCRKSRELDEAVFWQAVAEALAWECNPQPLIAPDLGDEPQRPVRARPPASRRGIEMPTQRSTVLRFQRDLRELWKRYRAGKDATDRAKDDAGS